ncbi:uncharacterized protein [Acropora muricata]|uniref:uncharacterized protein n=1 Tax=Acropora muricata TaxID=159855 RepID=UPI0034E527D5
MFKDDGKCGESLGMSDLTKLTDCKDGVTSHLSTYHVSQMRLSEHYELILVGTGLFDCKYEICDKTELLVLHAKHRPKPSLDSITVGDATVEPTSGARNIGVVFDDTMSVEEHVNELCRTAFYHIRNISRIRLCLSIDSTKTLVHALVTSRYCNALLYGLPDYLIQRLQYVMNAEAKVIICERKFDHVTPLLIELHWLPVRQRIVFKILLYTFKALHGVTPMYLTELISPYIPRRALRSADQLLLEQPTHKLKSIGLRAFSVCALYLWNSLPFEIKSGASVSIFKAKL